MNKTPIIAGVVSVLSLAAGGAAGYLYAKKRFDEELDARIDEQVEATKKHYSILLMQAKEENSKPDSPADLIQQADEDAEALVAVLTGGEPSEEVQEQAVKAMRNYQGIDPKPPIGSVVTNNIFTAPPATPEKAKKTLPPRGENGKFMPAGKTPKAPYRITQEEFLQNDPDYDQENLRCFVNDGNMLLDYDKQEVDVARVGADNLLNFPDEPEGVPSIICIRNEGLEVDYEIQKAEEDLAEYMGLDDMSSDEPAEYDQDEYADI